MNKSQKILIVDDTIENLQIAMNYIIEDAVPYAILAAQNGEIALKIASKELPDIIIMDWEMPVMNGIDCIRELRKLPETSNIPVIISTGIRLTPQDLRLAFEVGASDFIKKPLEKTEFIARINSHLKQAEYIEQIKLQSRIIEESEILRLENNIKALESGIEENRSIISYYDNLLSGLTHQLDVLAESDNLTSENIKNVSSAIEHARKTVINTSSALSIPDTTFVKSLLKAHKNLTPQEIQLSFMVKSNMPSKEIANLTFREITSVKVARSRLRKKLNLSETDNLTAYLNNF
jgi:response regulator RpfG family c-di-GMP phosphodiesterase/DNA-binding CsgD family transcriptional regulator